MRCLTLAEAFVERGAKCLFVCRGLPDNLAKLISRRGHYLALLPMGSERDWPLLGTDSPNWLTVDEETDSEETLGALKVRYCELMVVDHYGLGSRWEKCIRPHFNRIVALDDLANRNHALDYLIDQTHGRSAAEYQSLVPEHCKVMAGASYALLRKEFSRMRPYALAKRNKSCGKIKRVLVSLGGTDPDNITDTVLHGLTSCAQRPSVDVLIGGCNPHLQYLQKKWGRRSDIIFHVDAPRVPNLMVSADLCVGAGGITSWERCCLGLPTLGIITASNQIAIIKSLAAAEALENLGEPDSQLSARVMEAIDSFSGNSHKLSLMSEAAHAICDGAGTKRVIDTLTKLE
jgi:UDP-2,4-diacetamido-2,4,6-trideoxy-beta-L-altropyranose hydrolase